MAVGTAFYLIEEAARERRAVRRRRAGAALGVSAVVTAVWVVAVTAGGHWDRVVDSWEASLTMVFGSFVAGSTPQGGGAVAFPVFTKLLEVPAAVARNFSLCIQAVGMGTATLAILITRRRIERQAVLVGIPVAVASFLLSMNLLGDRSKAFWPSRLPEPYLKVTFTLLLASMAFIVYLGTKVRIRKLDAALPPLNARLYLALVVAGVLGGVVSSQVGSGADVLVYLFVVVLFGVDPRIGVSSGVIVMACVSVVGLLALGLADGQLDVGLSPGGEQVRSLGGEPVAGTLEDGELTAVFGSGPDSLPASRFDLFGLWIAAIPIVAWGAPLGSWVVSRMRARHLVLVVMGLAVAELLSTAVFLDDLHTFGALLAYAIAGLAAVTSLLYLLARHRRAIFRLPGLTAEETLSREHLDIVPGYQRQLEQR